MALAALAHAEEVVLTLAARMPHKEIVEDEIARRLEWMRLLAEVDERISVALTGSGLFVEMARAARAAVQVEQVSIVCGRDAAERAIGWDYGSAPGFAEQLNEFTMLVAPRVGRMVVDDALRSCVVELHLEEAFQLLSSTEARQRIEAGARWEDLVPKRIAERLRNLNEPLA